MTSLLTSGNPDMNISKDSSYRERSYSPCNKSFRSSPLKSLLVTWKSVIRKSSRSFQSPVNRKERLPHLNMLHLLVVGS